MTKNSLEKFLIHFIIALLIIITSGAMILFGVTEMRWALTWVITGYGLVFLGISLFSRRLHILNPLVLMPFTYMMYALGPLSNADSYSKLTVDWYLWYQLIGLCALIGGLLLLDQVSNEAPPVERDNDFAMQLAIVSIMALGAFSAIREVMAFGGLRELLDIGYGTDRYLVISNSATFGGSFQWLLLSMSMLFFYSLHKRSRWGLLLSILGGGFTTYLILVIGGRSTLVYVALFSLVLLISKQSRVMNWLYTVLVFVGIVFAQIFSYARAFLDDGLISAIQQVGVVVARSPHLILPLPKNINEFIIPGSSLLDILQRMPPVRLAGATYMGAVSSLVPGASRFLQGFGFNPSDWFLKDLYEKVYLQGGGRGFSPVTEGFLNFGVLGVVAQLFLYGLFARWLYQRMIDHNNYLTRLLYAGAFPILILDSMRIYLSSAVYKLSRVYLLPFFLYLFYYFITQYRYVAKVKSIERKNRGSIV